MTSSGISTHGDVEDGDYVEGRGEDGAHAFDRRLVQAVVGRQDLPVGDKHPKNTLACCMTQDIAGTVVVHSCAVWILEHATCATRSRRCLISDNMSLNYWKLLCRFIK